MSEKIYLPSDQVRVFPIAKERQITNSEILNSRLLTEKNMSNLIRQLLGGTNGFVINIVHPYKNDKKLVRVKFNLLGYYFDIKFSGMGIAKGQHTVHAVLSFDSSSMIEGEPQELAQDEKIDASAEGDSAYRYGGMYLIIDASEDEMSGSLHLFDFNSDGNGDIESVESNREDFFIFDINTLPIGGIDGRPKQS